ncbi:MAG: calcium-binding protein [Limnoraphis robusta]
MNFDIFDEQYYLQQYPYLQPAIEQGIIQSGLDHFQRFGFQLGLTGVSRYYNEGYYLDNNPDVAEAFNDRRFPSGLSHFIVFGYEEGRNNTTPDYDETFYLNSNPSVASQIEAGVSKSGFSHFIKVGRQQGLQTTSFANPEYLQRNPDVVDAINNGVLPTGQTHYREYGQFEGRSTMFTGTPSSDVIATYGEGDKTIYGVSVNYPSIGSENIDSNNDGEISAEEYSQWVNRSIASNSSPVVGYSGGSDEFDTLIGSSGKDIFVFGDTIVSSRGFFQGVQTFYKGEGEALIQGFNQAEGDEIRLVISSSETYSILPSGDDLIIAVEGDTIAILEDGADLTLIPTNQSDLSGFYQSFTLI